MTTVKRKVAITLKAHCRRTIKRSPEDEAEKPRPKGKIPRVSRLMALAIHFDEMLRSGEAKDSTELAVLYDITQPRMSQISSLALLAPEIQEALLNLPRETTGRSQIHEKCLRPICAQVDFDRQQEMWKQLKKRIVESPLNE